MKQLPFFADPDTREDILDHISGYVFDRAMVRGTAYDEPMIRTTSADFETEQRLLGKWERKRSVRR